MTDHTELAAPTPSEYRTTHGAVLLTIAAVGAASVAAAVYTVKGWEFSEVVMPLAAIVAAGFAFLPPLLAKPWGEATNNTKAALMIFTLMMMVCDGLFQLNLVRVAAELGGVTDINYTMAGLGVAFFQIATFFLKGTLYTATVERGEDLSREHAEVLQAQARLAEAEAKARARDEKNARRRQRRAAKTGGHLQAV